MDPHLPYVLPLKGLKDHHHQFVFDVDGAFFQAFEDSPISDASVKMTVELDKKPSLLVLDFSFSGVTENTCDRCLVPIQLPVKGVNQLIVKYGEINKNEDEDVVYIPHEASSWSIAQYVYEYIILALPMIKVYDCENDDPLPCDLELLERLNTTNNNEDSSPSVNPFGEALKDWNK